MIRNILTGLGVLVLVVVAVGFGMPNRTRVSESVVIAASPAEVYETLNSLKEFNEWSPWAKMEPTAAYTFEGPDTGPGAKLSWEGDIVGKGSQEIMASTAQRIDLDLEFEGQGGGRTWYEIEPATEGARVTWAFESQPYGANILSRYIGALLVGGMLREQYAEGLSDLKVYQEAKSPGAQ